MNIHNLKGAQHFCAALDGCTRMHAMPILIGLSGRGAQNTKISKQLFQISSTAKPELAESMDANLYYIF